MQEAIIDVQGLSKTFQHQNARHGDPAIKEHLWDKLKSNFSNKNSFLALDNINFKIQRGTTLGIIGKNGAGKSTLIKILSRIIPPTKGRIISRGKISSLVEIGTGFHPDLTGEENVYLNGAFLGLKRNEIKNKFDQIIEFAEVHKFLHLPLKRFSTGMQLRLAFSIAVYLQSDILILDEILAVGDAEFQSRCLEKISSITKQEGRTVIIVSHNASTLNSSCDKCLWLENGKQIDFGPTRSVLQTYEEKLSII